jgi:hypothetical protein
LILPVILIVYSSSSVVKAAFLKSGFSFGRITIYGDLAYCKQNPDMALT